MSSPIPLTVPGHGEQVEASLGPVGETEVAGGHRAEHRPEPHGLGPVRARDKALLKGLAEDAVEEAEARPVLDPQDAHVGERRTEQPSDLVGLVLVHVRGIPRREGKGVGRGQN
jgi:hypothetical protein